MLDINLKEFATDRQSEYIDTVNSTGGYRAAARELGITHTSILQSIDRLKAKAAKQGYSPNHDMTKTCPDGYLVKGTSTLYGKDGEAKIQWVKTNIDQERQEELIRVFTETFVKPLDKVTAPAREPVSSSNSDIIPWFQIGDGHIGMLAHEDEVGHNFDLRIAENELVLAMETLIDRVPACDRCVIQDLGDMTHYETFSAKTEASGHALDFDSRYPKMIKTYARVMRAIIDKALSKFENVDVIVNQGNHSRSNDSWMKIFLDHVYESTERLNVINNSNVFIPYRMGNTFVMSHHSDKCRPNRLVDVMSTDYAQDWGESLYRYIDIGHIHHKMVAKESSGATIESWNQIAPSDKYAHDAGWRSRACLTCVLRSKTYGEKGRETLTAEEVKDRLDNLTPGDTCNKRRSVYTV